MNTPDVRNGVGPTSGDPGPTKKSKLRRVLFAGGGTGGHVFMSVALAQELKRIAPEVEVLFVGTKRGLEARVVEPLGFRLATIEVGALNKVGLKKMLSSLFGIPFAIWSGGRIVRVFRPDIIVGVGGYSSGPVVLAGKLMGCRAVLIEPNAYPGLTNRLLRRWVDAAAVAFEEAGRAFGAKARVTGIPIRGEFHRVEPQCSTSGPLSVLVTGGSQGSTPINRLVCDALSFLPPGKVQIIHQTGRFDLKQVTESYREKNFPAQITDFIDNIPDLLGRIDLVVSRAGASTVAELTAAGKPSILIPFPQAADDHQRKNAAALVKRGAALMLEQNQTSGRELAELLIRLADNREELRTMAEASRSLARPGSVAAILDLLNQLAKD